MTMSKGLLEKHLIEHCAPTLAGMKTANLFNYSFQSKQEVLRELGVMNQLLNSRGVSVMALIWREQSVLIYVYRLKGLSEELEKDETMELLARFGYTERTVPACLGRLQERLHNCGCFPHEIGVFLGYPLEDVRGFIENGGKNCKTCGLWKVYCNECEKQKLFEKFKRCTEIYIRVFKEGRSLLQMTVAI